jgi:hypothetical protein
MMRRIFITLIILLLLSNSACQRVSENIPGAANAKEVTDHIRVDYLSQFEKILVKMQQTIA